MGLGGGHDGRVGVAGAGHGRRSGGWRGGCKGVEGAGGVLLLYYQQRGLFL